MKSAVLELFDLVNANETGKLAKFIIKHKNKKLIDWNAKYPHLTALHIACRENNMKIMELLASIPAVDVNALDLESKMTPLAFAFYAGNLSLGLRLIELRPDTKLTYTPDNDGHYVPDIFPFILQNYSCPDYLMTTTATTTTTTTTTSRREYQRKPEVLTWGSNSNYNLGVFDGENRQNPDSPVIVMSVDEYPIELVLAKYHSAVVGSNGSLWTCGHVKSGRLGFSSQQETQLVFKKISIEPVKTVALSSYHSVVVTRNGEVYTFGLNDLGQLGYSKPDASCTESHVPRKLQSLKKREIIGAAASRIHSIVYSCTTIYAWGFNKGQLGIIVRIMKIIAGFQNTTQTGIEPLPRIVSSFPNVPIKQIVVNECAKFPFAKNIVFSLHLLIPSHFINPRLPSMFQIPNIHSRLPRGPRPCKLTADSKQFFVLNDVGAVFAIDIGMNKFQISNVKFSRELNCSIASIASSIDSSLLILTSQGKVFYGTEARSGRLSSRRLSNSSEHGSEIYKKPFGVGKIRMNLTHVNNLKWVKDIVAGPSGTFGVVKDNFPVPFSNVTCSSLEDSLERFFREEQNCNFSKDLYSDFEIACDGKILHVHRIILSKRLNFCLENGFTVSRNGIVMESDGNRLIVSGIHFDNLLILMNLLYFGHCDVLDVSDEFLESFQGILNSFPVKIRISLQKNKLYIDPIQEENLKIKQFGDITVRCGDGEVVSSKLLLSCKSTFFHAMFRLMTLSFLSEHAKNYIDLPHLSTDGFIPVLQYIHMPTTSGRALQDLSLESLIQILEISDELLIDDLKWNCENSLIKLMDSSNILMLSEIAEYYLAGNLLKSVVAFIASQLDILIFAHWKFSPYITNHVEKFVKSEILSNFRYSRHDFVNSVNSKIKEQDLELRQKKKAYIDYLRTSGLVSAKSRADLLASEKSDIESRKLPDSVVANSDNCSSNSSPALESNMNASSSDELIFQFEKDLQLDPDHEHKKSSNRKKKFVSLSLPPPPENVLSIKTWNVPLETQSSENLIHPVLQEETPLKQNIPKMKSTPMKRLSQRERKELANISVSPAKPENSWTNSPKMPPISSSIPSSSIPISGRPSGSPWSMTISPLSYPSGSISPRAPNHMKPIASPSFKDIQMQQKQEITNFKNLVNRKKPLTIIQIEESALIQLKAYYESSKEPSSGESFTFTTQVI